MTQEPIQTKNRHDIIADEILAIATEVFKQGQRDLMINLSSLAARVRGLQPPEPGRYNALDNHEKAEALITQLTLEHDDLVSSLNYDDATSWCDDCPSKDWESWSPESYSEMEFGPRIADYCCKDEPDHNSEELAQLRRMTAAKAALRAYIDRKDTDDKK